MRGRLASLREKRSTGRSPIVCATMRFAR
jgi:hypothetical protein